MSLDPDEKSKPAPRRSTTDGCSQKLRKVIRHDLVVQEDIEYGMASVVQNSDIIYSRKDQASCSIETPSALAPVAKQRPVYRRRDLDVGAQVQQDLIRLTTGGTDISSEASSNTASEEEDSDSKSDVSEIAVFAKPEPKAQVQATC